mmetsp:Transcript_3102/g.9474  ORF Transcript_3102/g.9474 Transcript_3102/m.9474 type:complete len:273 (+) Transcript_3102:586-1404(+)
MGQELRKLELCSHDTFVIFCTTFVLLGHEGRFTDQHVVQKCTKRPPVRRLVITLAKNDFRCHVVLCAAPRVRFACEIFLCETEIRQHDMAVHIEQHVFRLHVSVKNPFRVQKFEGKNYFSSIKASHFLAHQLLLFHVEKQFATVCEIHHKIDALARLKRTVQTHDEWQIILFFRCKQCEHVSLHNGLLLVIFALQPVLSDDLHCVYASGWTVPHLIDGAVCALADNLNEMECFQVSSSRMFQQGRTSDSRWRRQKCSISRKHVVEVQTYVRF